jgi:hypothetical protein
MHKASSLALAVSLMFVGSGSPTLTAQGGPPQSLPNQASQVAQDIVEFDGELEVQYEDSAAGARLLHFLHTGTRRLQLRFTDAPLDWQSGTRVKVRGRLQDTNTLALSASGGVQMLSLPTVNTFGEQKTLVLLINFQDNASQPYTTAAASAVTFQTVSDYYRENSYQQTWLTGAVYGWLTLNTTSGSCATDTWATLADQAAQAAGVNVSNYPRRIYAFPNTASCGWWGLGMVGGNPSRAWINGDYQLKVVGHEFGHNLGEYHSHSRPCEAAGCTTVEYGDDHDIMGQTSSGHLNAFQKERLGWLNYGSSPSIQTITQSGDYHVNALEPTGSGPKGLKIPIATDGSGLRTYYYIEAQTGAGFDSGNAPGVLVHSGYEGSGDSSYQIDFDPSTPTFDGVLDPGQAFSDAAAGVTITADAADANGATVTITVTGPACAPAAPTITMSPGTMVSAAAGAGVSYTLTVRNNDSSTCAASTFGLSSLVPSGWTGTFGVAAVSLNPGASSNTSMMVTSSPAASGQYTFQAGAVRPSSSGSVTGSINVISSLSVTVTASSIKGGQYQVSATVRANAAAAAGVSVSFTIVDSVGGSRVLSANTNSSGVATVTFRPRKNDPTGMYSVQAVATLGSISSSGSVTFSVR